jgi:hypothetical protein
MFNECSQLTCKNELECDHPDMVATFDLLYFDDNVIWYQQPDGTWGSFLQQEGYAQGCPLSGTFALKVLHVVLKDLKAQLNA